MNNFVYIKSFSNGLKIILDDKCEFKALLEDCKEKFSDSKKFFKGSHLAVSFEGRKLSETEESMLVNTIEVFGEFTILYIVENNEKEEQFFLKAVKSAGETTEKISDLGKIYYGNLKKGETLETPASIVLLGDVEPGAVIKSNGNIIILGGLYGTACCINPNEYKKCFITANDMSAEGIFMGDVKYTSREKPKWVVRPKMTSKIAYFKDGCVCVEPVSKNVIEKLLKLINLEENV
jgi:septum site-determining protein MinC